MGIRCSCGVFVDASKTGVNVRFDGLPGTQNGTLAYSADVCADRLDTSTLSLSFLDTDGNDPVTSFLLEVDPSIAGTAITSVTCRQMGGNCEVTVAGVGRTTGFGGTALRSFEAEFRDMVAPAAVDNVQKFDITGFFNQTGAEPVPQGSIIARGCAEIDT